AITEINSGVYAFDHAQLVAALAQLRPDNSQGELYLTDVIGIARAAGQLVRGDHVDDEMLVAGCNDRIQLSQLGRELNRRIVERHQLNGV
ncbi:bifunctional UDP-N-acetylglucosamine diphosphorylase/glucosamine-1-phosphate N-acetyltransferase GlmU, partial [Mycobacterium kansasii]